MLDCMSVPAGYGDECCPRQRNVRKSRSISVTEREEQQNGLASTRTAAYLPSHHRSLCRGVPGRCAGDSCFSPRLVRQWTADAYSDLDLGLITTDEAYEDLFTGREAFIRLLGEPLFLETFDLPNVVFFFFSDGTEGELSIGRTSDFNHINRGAYRTLLDKTGILAGAVFTGHEPAQAEQLEVARRLIAWYWHDYRTSSPPSDVGNFGGHTGNSRICAAIV